MIGLGYYRNKILHWFNREGVVACAYHALEGFNPASNDQSIKGVNRKELLQGALFLHDLLRMEFVRKDCSKDRNQLENAVDHLLTDQVLHANADGQRLAVSSGGQPFFSMLCTLFWPFVDSYWVAITSLFALRPGLEISMDDLLKRIQWLAETVRRCLPFEFACALIRSVIPGRCTTRKSSVSTNRARSRRSRTRCPCWSIGRSSNACRRWSRASPRRLQW